MWPDYYLTLLNLGNMFRRYPLFYCRDKRSSAYLDLFPALTGAYLGGLSGGLISHYLSPKDLSPESVRRRRNRVMLGIGLGALKGGITAHYLIPKWVDRTVSSRLRGHSYPQVVGAGALVGGGYGAGVGALVGGPVGAAAGALPGAAMGGATNMGYKLVADHSRLPVRKNFRKPMYKLPII